MRGRRWAIFSATAIVVALLTLRLWPHPPLRDTVPVSTAIYARDGELLCLTLAPDDQYRLWVPLADIDPRLVEAVQLYEDRWFRWHAGVNPIALGRAMASSYVGGSRQGASTITMQLARRLYRISSNTVRGKLRQIAAALWLEVRYGKREILEAYLNLAPYGGNVEGVGAASLIYFHKRAQQLTLPEVLTLAVIPQNPKKRGRAGNDAHPDLKSARKRLWAQWLARHPDAGQYKSAVHSAELKSSASKLPFRAPHFTDRVLRGARPGEVWSSLDMHLQTTVERILVQYIQNRQGQGINNASALLLDRATGEIRALVGSADYFNAGIEGQVNGTEAKRSPGSTLKPFIYALAIDQGVLHPLTVLKDAPIAYGPFSPENFDGRFVGPISAQDALVRSRNVPAVLVAAKLKQPNLYEFLKSTGISNMASQKHYGLALALGGGEVTMEELARLYLMLANRGVQLPLTDRRIFSSEAAQQRANANRYLSEEASFVTMEMLKANPRPDTAEPARPAIAWKTGTSWGFHDAWTAGIFGQYVLVVWIGNFNNVGNPAFVGVQAAAPLFFKITDSIRGQHLDEGEPNLPMPPNVSRVEVCSASGDLPNDYCKDRAQTWFIPGKSPIKVSTLHRLVKIDTRTGKATCDDGPQVKTEVFEFWPTDMQRLFREAGMPRRQPPVVPDCGAGIDNAEDAPVIITPTLSSAYSLQVSKRTSIPLRANSTGAQSTLFWFANSGLIGKSRPSETLSWIPSLPGHYQLRVIDEKGRSDEREVDVELIP